MPYRHSKCNLNVSIDQLMFSTFTDSVKVLCTVSYRYSKCSLNVSKCHSVFSAFTDSVKVICKVLIGTVNVT